MYYVVYGSLNLGLGSADHDSLTLVRLVYVSLQIDYKFMIIGPIGNADLDVHASAIACQCVGHALGAYVYC